MNDDQLKRFLLATYAVDGGCPYCWAIVLTAFVENFPDLRHLVDEVWSGEGMKPGGWERK